MRCRVYDLSRDIVSSSDAKFYVYRSYGSRVIKFSFYHVTSRDHMIKGPYDLVSWSTHSTFPPNHSSYL